MIYDYLTNIHFAYPLVLVLLALVPGLAYLSMRLPRFSALRVSSLPKTTGLLSWKTTFRSLPLILRLLAITCLILALARPRFSYQQRQVQGEGIDIMLCLDISGSMLAQDFKPNRLEAAKNVASDFINARPTDRIGLVIFSGESYTLCPLTGDRLVLKNQLFSIESGMLEDGTSIGSGLATCVERLRASASKSKVVILLTDGENNGGFIDPNTAKEIAKSFGVKVYTVGVGTEGFAPVPVQTSTGVHMQNQKVSIDEKLLTQIAAETGGKYFRARDNESLSSVYREIDQMEKSKVEVRTSTLFTDQFYPFAGAATLFLFLDLLLRFFVLRKFP